ncbi:cytochrome P450 [Mollisia scopiformis]|uniref:Cytochrome P450 n=1 Tax=Mollisia scopiformis TaxID=149040 RepID=A0A132B5W4_MOLSC|nr:cytochrome P450 [Mollisia scopiformis]KUJ07792.1 cytochrome P450 [Mollisia scopiformis]
MGIYLTLILCLGLAEIVRRCISSLMLAFTGPLSKIPGPFVSKLTRFPWALESIQGKHMNFTHRLFQRYGDIVRVAPTTVLIADKAGIQKILVEEDLVKAPFFDALRLHPGNPMLVTERNKASHKSTDVMSATSLGGSSHLVTSNDTKLKKTFVSILVKAAINGQFPYLRYIPFWPQPISAEMNRLLENVLKKRDIAGQPAKRDIVQIILDAHQTDPVGFPEIRMRDEITMFMVAGSETTSASTTAILLHLVNNPAKLKLLEEEIESKFSENDEITFAKLHDLPYLNAVIWEGLRLMTAPAGLLRYTEKPTIISGYEIPSNTIVQPWPMALMKDPRIWPDADSFIPERWLGVYKGVEANRSDVLAFSAGSRNCIGWQFAMREMRLILARLVRRYELSLVEGQSHERRYHSTPWFVQGFYKVGIKQRQPSHA